MTIAIKGPLAAAFTGSNGIGDFNRDVPFCPLSGRTDETVSTAYIKPVENYGKPGFEITLGNLNNLARPSLPPRVKLNLARKVVRHEVCHARFTDFTVGPEWCARGGNFTLLNLFEDCRIEHCERLRLQETEFGHGKFKRKGFNWSWPKYTDAPASVASPGNLLLARKYGHEIIRIAYTGPAPISGKGIVRTVLAFYQRACLARKTRDLIPIMDEWLKEFPAEASMEPLPGVNETITADGDKRGESATGDAIGADCPSESPSAEKAESEIDGDGKGGNAPSFHRGNDCDLAVASRLRAIADGLLIQTDAAIGSIGETGNRLHLPGIIAGLPSFKRVGALAKPRLTLVCDMSSSMLGEWANGLHATAVALASVKGMEVQVWLSGGGNAERVSPATLRNISPRHGCESLALAFNRIAARNGFGDLTVVLTDGQVGDGEVNAAAYRSHGLNCVAGTIGTVRDLPKFVRQFGRVCLKPTAAELVRAIVSEARKACKQVH